MLGGAAAYLGPCTWRRALGGGAQHLGGAPLCIWRKTENCWKLQCKLLETMDRWKLMENCWKTAQATKAEKEVMAPAGAALMRLCSPARTH